MQKQNLIILIVLVTSLVVGGLSGFYFYLSRKAGEPLRTPTTTKGNYFGLGDTNQATTTPTPSEPSDTSTTTPIVTATIPRPIPRLRHLTIAPVAGSAFVSKDIIATTTTTIGTSTKTTAKVIGTTEVFHWLDRATGKIFETSTTTLETTRISNTTIPKIYEAYFLGSKGNEVIFRDLLDESDAIRTRYGSLKLETATSSEQIFQLKDLPVNMTQIAISPAKDQIFSIMPGSNRGVISKVDGNSPTNVFSSPFNEWLVSWPTAQTVVLNTKPSGITEGYAYTFDVRTKAFVKLVGNKKGLTTLMSPDGANVLVGESPLGTIQLSVLNRKSGDVRNLFVRTFPEKCIWSKKEAQSVFCAVPQNTQYDTYPDAWYMGQVSFSDDIWKIDTTTGESRLLVEPVYIVGQPLDMVNLSLSKNEDFLMFQDKNDLSLWSYQLVVPVVKTATTTATTTPQI